MFKKFLSVLTVLLFFVTMISMAQIKVGYLNLQQVLNELPATDSAATELNNFVSQKQQEFQQRATEVLEAETEFENNKASLSQEQQAQREEEINKMNQELTNFQSQIQTQIQQRQQQLLAPIYDRIDEATSTVAENNGLDFVLNERTTRGDNIVYFSSDQKQNITEQVLQQLQDN
ncbi:MAG: OmpH family outer membrane protein [Balneolaceae bacterium]|nr:OmpH family outer membrane protein [Balneolaceae bacterium]